jgi:hypothetical protein
MWDVLLWFHRRAERRHWKFSLVLWGSCRCVRRAMRGGLRHYHKPCDPILIGYGSKF